MAFDGDHFGVFSPPPVGSPKVVMYKGSPKAGDRLPQVLDVSVHEADDTSVEWGAFSANPKRLPARCGFTYANTPIHHHHQ